MKNKTYKIFLMLSSIVMIFSGLSCDDRKASETVDAEGLTLAFIESQPVANGATVGEAIVGYAGVYLIVELRDSDNQPVKNGIISFSAKTFLSPSSYGTNGRKIEKSNIFNTLVWTKFENIIFFKHLSSKFEKYFQTNIK